MQLAKPQFRYLSYTRTLEAAQPDRPIVLPKQVSKDLGQLTRRWQPWSTEPPGFSCSCLLGPGLVPSDGFSLDLLVAAQSAAILSLFQVEVAQTLALISQVPAGENT